MVRVASRTTRPRDEPHLAATFTLYVPCTRVNDSTLFGTWRYLIVTEAQIAATIDWKQLTR